MTGATLGCFNGISRWTSSRLAAWLHDNKVSVPKVPSQITDLKPELRRLVQTRQPANLVQIHKFSSIPANYCEKMVEAHPKRPEPTQTV